MEEKTCLNCSILEKNDGVYTCELMNIFIKGKDEKEEDVHPAHIQACLYHNGEINE